MTEFKLNTDRKYYYTDYSYNLDILNKEYSHIKMTRKLKRAFAVLITITKINQIYFNKLSDSQKISFLNKKLEDYLHRKNINKVLLKMHRLNKENYIFIKNQFKNKLVSKDVYDNANYLFTESTSNLCNHLKYRYLKINLRKEKLYELFRK